MLYSASPLGQHTSLSFRMLRPPSWVQEQEEWEKASEKRFAGAKRTIDELNAEIAQLKADGQKRAQEDQQRIEALTADKQKLEAQMYVVPPCPVLCFTDISALCAPCTQTHTHKVSIGLMLVLVTSA